MMVFNYHPCDNNNNNHHRRRLHCSKKVLLPLLLWTSATSATSSASEVAGASASIRRNRNGIAQRVLRGDSPSASVDVGRVTRSNVAAEWMQRDGVSGAALVSEEEVEMEGADEWGEMDVGEFSNSTSTPAEDEGELDLGDVSTSNSNLGRNEDVDDAEEDGEEAEDGSFEVGEFSSANSEAKDADEAIEEDEGSLEIGEFSSANLNSTSNNNPRQSEEETDEEDVMTQWPDPVTLPSTENNGTEEDPTDAANQDKQEDQIEEEEELVQLPTDFLPPDFFPSEESSEENSDSTSNLCSCSPRSYGFRLTLDQSCLVNDLNDNGGIGVTLCILSTSNDGGNGNATDADTVPVVVTSLQFLEFDTSGNVVVINQDDTYNNVTFHNGDIVRFDSVTMDLDENLDLENQLGYLPGGVQLTIRGRPLDSANDGDADAMVINRLTWSYTNECEFVPVENGDRIGWVTMEEIEPASTAFCSALVTTTTTSTTTTTTTSTTPMETTTTTMMTTTTTPETTTTETTTTTEATSVATTTTTKPHKIDSKSSKMAKSSTLDAKAGKKYSSAKSDKYFIFTKTGKQTIPSSKSGKAEIYQDDEDMSMMSIPSGSAKSGKSDRLFLTRSRQDGMIRRR